MASYSNIQHRFANKQAGKNGRISASSCRYEGRNFYSYSTVFGQWLDIEKNVVAIFDGSTSQSSSKHKLWKGVFPDDVHVFPLDFGGGYYGWRNCNLVSSYNFKDEDFKEYHRMQMIDHYVGRIYDQLASINGGKKKGLENVSFESWGYITELCLLYKDTSIAKYLKWTKQRVLDDNISRKRKLVKLLKDGERNVEVLTDALFGDGTFKKYWDYCARYRKSADKRSKVESLCERLGIASPYESSWRGGRLDSGLAADQIRKLTAKERLDLHFASIMRDEQRKEESAVKEKYNKNKRNAYRWIIGAEPVLENQWSETNFKRPLRIINKDNGEEYDIDGYLHSISWCSNFIDFDYDQYRKSQDKEQWIQNFYTQCKVVSEVITAYNILERVNAHYVAGEYSWYKRYVDDEHLVSSTTPEEYAKCKEFIDRQEKFYNDLEARKRAEAIRRQREEEERRREKELQERLKQEQIQECLANGVEGGRNLWRFHYMSINEAKSKSNIPDFQFYDGGNVLMRFGMKKDLVETSMSIKLDIPTCKKFWKLINIWHKDPSKFKECKIDTHYSGTYTIVSYENDILTAGCHKIAYTEMERMYNEIIAAV